MEEVKVNKEQSVAKAEAAPLRRATDYFMPMVPFGKWFGMSPFALMREFTDEMDRAFRGGVPGKGAGMWSPVVDVRQCNGDLVITAELPGLTNNWLAITENAASAPSGVWACRFAVNDGRQLIAVISEALIWSPLISNKIP